MRERLPALGALLLAAGLVSAAPLEIARPPEEAAFLHQAGAAAAAVAPLPLAAAAAGLETAPIPSYLYHVTSIGAWKQIQSDRILKTALDRAGDTSLKGIFTVERDNFSRNWAQVDKFKGTPYELKISGVRRLVDYLLDKMERERRRNGGDAGEDGLVTLRIRVDPTDTVLVRDNRHLLAEKSSLETYQGSLKPAEKASSDERENGMLEYILRNPIPLERISPVVSLKPGVLRSAGSQTAPTSADLFQALFPVEPPR